VSLSKQVEIGYVSPDNVFMGLGELERQISILHTLVAQERPGAREQWQRRIAELHSEAVFLRTVLNRFLQSRGKVAQEAKEREELLARRYGKGGDLEAPARAVEELLEEGASYQRSSAMMNDILMSGQATLSNLLDQRSSLKSARKKVLDVLNLLGVSHRITGMAERRDTVDKLIVAGGMVVTLLVLWLCWKAVS
jgi:Golgi SNAP receptor complex protein 2